MSNIQVPKDPIIKIQHYVNKKIIVNFSGGRQIQGILKSSDGNLNMIIDDTIEQLRDPKDFNIITDKTRQLGLIIVRGTQVVQIMSAENYQQIENPFDLVE